jgi:nucleoside-diphosphate-sugar epimerase
MNARLVSGHGLLHNPTLAAWPIGEKHRVSMFSGKRVLVTGGCSFIGSHLAERLVQRGAKVRIADDLSSGRIENISTILDKIDYKNGDLRDSYFAQTATKDIDVVFHLANIHGGRGFIETHPGEICQNFLIDGNVFYHSMKNKVERICYASSACAYPTNLQSQNTNEQPRYLSEEMADPFAQGGAMADGEYGWGKFMGEMALKAYNKQYGQKGVSCRLFTVYGPRENESHAIIAFIAKALARQDPFEVWGSGQQDRNFTYVDDVVDGLLLAAARIDDCRAVNIGSSEIVRIIAAAQSVCEAVGFQPNSFYFDRSKPEGVHARAAAVCNQLKWLDWSPKIPFSEGVAKTVEWYRNSKNIKEINDAIANKLFSR